MCLIAAMPRDTKDSTFADLQEYLRESWRINKDGAGFAFALDGKLSILKPFFSLDNLLASLKGSWSKVKGKSDLIVHLRYATHGALTSKNTHPHSLAKGKVALAHNGVIPGFGSPVTVKNGISDTRHYCRYALRDLTESELLSKEALAVIEEDIGRTNKFALLGSDGRMRLVNAKAGYFVDGVWYSSYPSKPYVPPKDNHYGMCGGVPHGWRGGWSEEDELEAEQLAEDYIRRRSVGDAATRQYTESRRPAFWSTDCYEVTADQHFDNATGKWVIHQKGEVWVWDYDLKAHRRDEKEEQRRKEAAEDRLRVISRHNLAPPCLAPPPPKVVGNPPATLWLPVPAVITDLPEKHAKAKGLLTARWKRCQTEEARDRCLDAAMALHGYVRCETPALERALAECKRAESRRKQIGEENAKPEEKKAETPPPLPPAAAPFGESSKDEDKAGAELKAVCADARPPLRLIQVGQDGVAIVTADTADKLEEAAKESEKAASARGSEADAPAAAPTPPVYTDAERIKANRERLENAAKAARERVLSKIREAMNAARAELKGEKAPDQQVAPPPEPEPTPEQPAAIDTPPDCNEVPYV